MDYTCQHHDNGNGYTYQHPKQIILKERFSCLLLLVRAQSTSREHHAYTCIQKYWTNIISEIQNAQYA